MASALFRLLSTHNTTTGVPIPTTNMDESLQVCKNYSFLYQRLRKTFYYGYTKKPIIECSSLPLTEVTIDLIHKTILKNRRTLDVLDVNYASHILHQACLSPASIIIAMIYLERLKNSNADYLRQISPCELFLVSLIVASKFLFDTGEDEIVYNDEWASIANLEIEELNRIEREFLNALNWSCYVDPNTFLQEIVKFEALLSMNECSKRQNHHMTYLELITLLEYLKCRHKVDEQLWSNAIDFAKSIFIFSLAYCAAIGVMLVSFSIVFSIHYMAKSHIQHLNSNNTITYDLNLEHTSLDYSAEKFYSKMIYLVSQNLTYEHLDTINYQLFFETKQNRIIKC